jgi:hypothetical protein
VMSELSAEQTRLAELWEEHMRHEFQTCSTEDTLATMVEDAPTSTLPLTRIVPQAGAAGGSRKVGLAVQVWLTATPSVHT